eukprot:14160501-Ditylum_brightwellii.AAC.1
MAVHETTEEIGEHRKIWLSVNYLLKLLIDEVEKTSKKFVVVMDNYLLCLSAFLPKGTLWNGTQCQGKTFYGVNCELFDLPWFIQRLFRFIVEVTTWPQLALLSSHVTLPHEFTYCVYTDSNITVP